MKKIRLNLVCLIFICSNTNKTSNCYAPIHQSFCNEITKAMILSSRGCDVIKDGTWVNIKDKENIFFSQMKRKSHFSDWLSKIPSWTFPNVIIRLWKRKCIWMVGSATSRITSKWISQTKMLDSVELEHRLGINQIMRDTFLAVLEPLPPPYDDIHSSKCHILFEWPLTLLWKILILVMLVLVIRAGVRFS